MRILFMGNNWVAWKVADWLQLQGEEIVGLVLHPPEKRSYGDEILTSTGVEAGRVFDGSELRQRDTWEAIEALYPDLCLSIFFGYILRPRFIEMMPLGCLNLHPALLPYNRGSYPNIWSIIDRTPAGVTLHYIDAGVDTGDIVAQREVAVEAVDTGETLYRKLERACVEVFKEAWPAIRMGRSSRQEQPSREGSEHRMGDMWAIDEIDLDREYTARDLINILRARTFPPHSGAYFIDKGDKIYMELKLFYAEEGKSDCG
jgi:methionyl-tRNA formyltransferase